MTQPAMELYHSPLSPCAQKVRLVLEEKRLSWTSRLLDMAEKQNLRPEYLSINPKGLIPALVHDGAALTESSIICEFLDDRYEPDRLKPGDAPGRARMRNWMRFIDDVVHPQAGALAWPILVRPAVLRKTPDEQAAFLDRIIDPARRRRQEGLLRHGLSHPETRQAMAVFRRAIERMDVALATSGWLAGESYSLADAAVTPYISMLWQFGLSGFVARLSARVMPWFEQARARDAFDRAIVAFVPPARWAEIAALGQDARAELEGA